MKIHAMLALPLLCLLLLALVAWARANQPTTSEASAAAEADSPPAAADPPAEAIAAAVDNRGTDATSSTPAVGRTGLIVSLTIFVLAIFVGFEVITKVPPTLHTPLMSGSNAISGITLVGALLVVGAGLNATTMPLGLIAIVLATINVVGGFLVTHRMLAMFKRK